jgi:hypothetical protein
MKGKSTFTKQEIEAISKLINAKVAADSATQKGIRRKIRNLGFYASDFGLGGGYTVADFLRVIKEENQLFTPPQVRPASVPLKSAKTSKRSASDEAYVLDLCDEVLKQQGLRQHRFDFLRGDTGVKLPVDAYYPVLNLVIEYMERQHSEPVKFFDKRETVSGMSRGEQRKKYDALRQTEIPKQGINLELFSYADFEHNGAKRLLRNREQDFEIIKKKLTKYVK